MYKLEVGLAYFLWEPDKPLYFVEFDPGGLDKILPIDDVDLAAVKGLHPLSHRDDVNTPCHGFVRIVYGTSGSSLGDESFKAGLNHSSLVKGDVCMSSAKIYQTRS